MRRGGSIYDSEDYYADAATGARLTPVLEWAVRALDRWRARAVVRATGLAGGKLLDVGAGDGKFMHYMQRLGFEVRGTTVSVRSANAAQSMFGLRLDVTEHLEAELASAPFDVVTYWHVFEHLERPSEHSGCWPSLVRPGGFVVIEIPSVRSIGARLCRRSWLGSDAKHHVNLLDPAALNDLLTEASFLPIRVERFSGKYSYAYLWSGLLGRLYGNRYPCDEILGLLKTPGKLLRSRLLWAANALGAIFYLAPLILTLMLYGVVVDRGEVVRIYARRRST